MGMVPFTATTQENVCTPKAFQSLYNYGRQLEPLQIETPLAYKPEGVGCYEIEDSSVAQAIENITHLANAGIDFSNPVFGSVYAANFAVAMRRPLQEALANSDENTTLIAPLRGGEVIQIMARAMGFAGKIPQIEAKRVSNGVGDYQVGIKQYGKRRPTIHDKVIVADDCIAAGGSTDALLQWALQQNPNITSIHTVAGIAVKQSAAALYQKWSSQYPGFRMSTGGLANGMNSHYYLQLSMGEKTLCGGKFPESYHNKVGDMGDAMDLSDPQKRNSIPPILQAISTGSLEADKVLSLTSKFLNQPKKSEQVIQEFIETAKTLTQTEEI